MYANEERAAGWYSYELTDATLRVTLSGTLTIKGVVALFERIGADPLFSCALPQLWLLEDVDCSALDGDALRTLGRQPGTPPSSATPPVALVAPEDVTYGLCRVYMAWLSGEAETVPVEVFRKCCDARAWLKTAKAGCA